jgi:hypothetical protein
VWIGHGEMAVEYAGQALSRYDVSLSRDEAKLEAVTNPRLFATAHRSPQLRLFGLEDALGENGWLKALRLDEYAARSPADVPEHCSNRYSLTSKPCRRHLRSREDGVRPRVGVTDPN